MPKEIRATKTAADDAAAARQRQFDALHQEMELAEYATGVSGHKVKRVPKKQAPERTAKRKALQQADRMEMAIEADDDYEEEAADGKRRKRLRGSKAIFDDDVLNSMPLANTAKRTGAINENNNKKVNEGGVDGEDKGLAEVEEENNRHELLQDVAALGIDLGPDEVDKIDFEGGDAEDDGSEYNESEDDIRDEKRAKASVARIKVSKTGLIKPNKRVMHRMKDFTSQRMAQMHGEAIGAHTRGMSETAVQKLREVAKLAPGAPQVYSSLGMVFESMLTEVERVTADEQGEHTTLARLQRRLELSQKAYASYHVAALLCKRDFVLWERSGDAAVKVAQISSELIDHMTKHPLADSSVSVEAKSTDDTTTPSGFDPNESPEKWRSDRTQWLEHALSAYQSSDNLRPPGVDLPCKLAQVHMRLGNIPDALSILTDLKNNTASGTSFDGENGGMEGSYQCWLLYAELMMRIGFECNQWNEGTSTNQHYMFKRWLRKNSKGFDWKERRLQALCLALEAAVGSESCVKLIKWMNKRAQDQGRTDADNDANADADAEETTAPEAGVADKDESIYEKERDKLHNLHNMELRRFDQLTKEMNLVAGSHIFKNRVATRQAIVEKHRAAMKDLAMTKYDEEQDADLSSENELPQKHLPLQASFATVFDIAELLLRQCIQLRLFEGGLLAVESVLNYSKERALRHEKKMERLQGPNGSLQNAGEEALVQSGFKYDQINLSDGSDEEDAGAFISDDEDLEEPGALESLKSLRLPKDIRSMHAICLLGVGGQDFVALGSMEQLLQSNELDFLGNDDAGPDAGIVDDPRWATFSKYFNAPISKSFLLASIADLMRENLKGHPNAHRILEMFRKHVFTLIDSSDQGLDLDQALSSSNELHRIHTMKIVVFAMKLLIECTRMDLATLDEPGEDEFKTIRKAAADSTYALNILTRFQYKLWNPRFADWSLPQPSIDIVSILSETLSVLVQAASLVENKRILDGFVKSILDSITKSRHLLSKICQTDAATKARETSTVGSWRSFPLPCSWQTSFQEKLSLRAYNLCVGCCVSSFSGWESSEFNLEQLSSSDVNFFGVSVDGPFVAGFLPQRVASSIAEQWDCIQSILPDLEVLPFEARLDERQKMSWYQKVMRNKQSIDSSKISLYGEADGVRALLSFSMLCLIAAKESEGNEREELIRNSMSVLLPMTQFSIDKQVWQSTIGTAVINRKDESKVGFYLDENCQWMGPRRQTKEERTQYTNKTQQQRLPRPSKPARPTRKRHQRSNIVRVATSALAAEWRKDDASVEKRHALQDAQLSMKKVDAAMKNLRKSRTLNSLEQASIDVSVALLTLVSHDECNNPFVCLQQAVMFAEMGAKRGNNDEPFKRFLPLKNRCSPSEALNILGRADCLRAVHFLHEAQYLCTWIASVCGSHRLKEENMPWNSRWRVVGILNYIIASSIDETGEALAQDGALRKWEDAAKKEISRGKKDAVAIARGTGSNRDFVIERPDEEMPLPALPGDQSEMNGYELNGPNLYEEFELPESEGDAAEDDNIEVVGV